MNGVETVPKHKTIEAILNHDSKYLEFKRQDGNSLLHVAAYRGCLDLVITLVEKGLSVNIRGSQGKTPLHVAYNHLDVTRYLIEHGADVNALDDWKTTPIVDIVMYGEMPVIRYMTSLKQVDFLAVSPKSGTCLCGAIRCIYHNIVDICLCLLAAEPRLIDIPEPSQRFTPLHMAVRNNNFELVTMLVEHKANVNAKDHEGHTPLWHLLRKPFDLTRESGQIKCKIIQYLTKHHAE